MQATRTRRHWFVTACGVTALSCITLSMAQAPADEPPTLTIGQEAAEREEADAGTDADATEGEASTSAPPADDVLRELDRLRQPPPVVAPERQPSARTIPGRVGLPAPDVDLDRSVLGLAPGQEPPPLRREGEFVDRRRGRLVRSPDGGHVLYQFEADDRESPELPMIMLPCRNLESMERIVQERGDRVVFVVSGEVFVYRGANYLLPTLYQIDLDRGNLQR